MKQGNLLALCALAWGLSLTATAKSVEYLVKLKDTSSRSVGLFSDSVDGTLESVSQVGKLYKLTTASETDTTALASHPNVEYIQKNHPIRLHKNPSIERNKLALIEALAKSDNPFGAPAQDNPAIQSPPALTTGADPLFSQAWGLTNVAAPVAWSHTPKGRDIIVAVTDTGVDYNHEDLIHNMWRNSKEVPNDGIDNDNNGYIDDIVGYDFFSNDNKPYDLTVSLLEILMGGGNPGHGTHCAGVVGARGNNGKGASGVATEVQLMALRFISEKGQGDTASAVKVVDYAVANGAHIISASWGSQGEEPGDNALRDAVKRAEAAGVLFFAAAGNGRANPATGGAAGYDNDTDSKPSYPATYEYDNVISVSALDSNNSLATFSNWGARTVDLGAPGVKILSTVPGNQYQDTVIDLGEMLKATWDGTSMATPFVAGAAAVIWSADPGLTWQEVKQKVLSNTQAVPALAGKNTSGGKLDLNFLKK